MRATKCVAQRYYGSGDNVIQGLLTRCLTLTYNAVHYAEENKIDNRRGMKGFYRLLKLEPLPSCYKLAAISRACAVIKSRKKSEKRRGMIRTTKCIKPLRSMVCLISGFFITMKGRLFIPLARDKYFDVQLNHHTFDVLRSKKLRSLTITPKSLSLCYSEEVDEDQRPGGKVWGVDRNEKNLTFGDREKAVQVDLSKVVKIKQTTREIIASFKRNDVRLRRRLSTKYWKRANHRGDRILHAATNFIVGSAAKNHAALTLEDLTNIRKMYRRGNKQQGEDFRFRMNSWSFWKVSKMLEYKSAWKGVTFIPLTKSDTYGSSSICSTCGEKLHRPANGDVAHARMLRCQKCKKWVDRDVNAVGNLSERGLARFASSLPRQESRSQQVALEAEEKGLAGEARKGNPPQTTVILRVDASKLLARSF